MTPAGAPVPDGADAVVQIENTEQLPQRQDGEKRIKIVKVCSSAKASCMLLFGMCLLCGVGAVTNPCGNLVMGLTSCSKSVELLPLSGCCLAHPCVHDGVQTCTFWFTRVGSVASSHDSRFGASCSF